MRIYQLLTLACMILIGTGGLAAGPVSKYATFTSLLKVSPKVLSCNQSLRADELAIEKSFVGKAIEERRKQLLEIRSLKINPSEPTFHKSAEIVIFFDQAVVQRKETPMPPIATAADLKNAQVRANDSVPVGIYEKIILKLQRDLRQTVRILNKVSRSPESLITASTAERALRELNPEDFKFILNRLEKVMQLPRTENLRVSQLEMLRLTRYLALFNRVVASYDSGKEYFPHQSFDQLLDYLKTKVPLRKSDDLTNPNKKLNLFEKLTQQGYLVLPIPPRMIIKNDIPEIFQFYGIVPFPMATPLAHAQTYLWSGDFLEQIAASGEK